MIDSMKKDIQDLIERALEGMGLEEAVSPLVTVPENLEHGDYSTNAAMLLTKQLKKSPAKIAEELKDAILKDQTMSDAGIIGRVEVAGPGFLNIYLSEASIISQVSGVLKMGEAYGFSPKSAISEAVGATVKPKNTLGKELTKESQKGEAKEADFSLQLGEIPPQISRKNAAAKKTDRQNKQIGDHSPRETIPEPSKKRVMIEFADPNPFKEIHIGHVRNISLGESYCRLMESRGAVVRRANYEGDVGLHVAKAIFGKLNGAPWQSAYAAGNKAFESNEDARQQIMEINKKIYAQDAQYRSLYDEGRKWSLDHFETIYARLGTHFDRYYFESEVAPVGKKMVLDHIADGVFEMSEGAAVYRGEKVGLHTRVFVTKEDYATYEAKDLALAPLKYAEWPYDLSIIMTGNEQSEYFRVMLAALAEIHPDLASKTRHMPFGMVNLSSGKMSSRTGNVVTAEWLIEEAKKEIYNILQKTDSKYTKEEQNQIVEKAAIAAIKYSMLRVNASSDISFDLKTSVSFDGDSGPYLQYTYARCKSVLRKSLKIATAEDGLAMTNREERILSRQIIQFPDVVAEAAENFAPNTLCTYLFHFAQQFNLFYAKNPIIGNDLRLTLTAATAQVIKNGLHLLGIETLEQM